MSFVLVFNIWLRQNQSQIQIIYFNLIYSKIGTFETLSGGQETPCQMSCQDASQKSE